MDSLKSKTIDFLAFLEFNYNLYNIYDIYNNNYNFLLWFHIFCFLFLNKNFTVNNFPVFNRKLPENFDIFFKTGNRFAPLVDRQSSKFSKFSKFITTAYEGDIVEFENLIANTFVSYYEI